MYQFFLQSCSWLSCRTYWISVAVLTQSNHSSLYGSPTASVECWGGSLNRIRDLQWHCAPCLDTSQSGPLTLECHTTENKCLDHCHLIRQLARITSSHTDWTGPWTGAFASITLFRVLMSALICLKQVYRTTCHYSAPITTQTSMNIRDNSVDHQR